MKTLFYLPVILFTLLSCDKDSTEKNTSITNGKWQLSETFLNSGGDKVNWTAAKNGYMLEFNSSSTFKTTDLDECNSGSFEVIDDVITYTYSCSRNTIKKFKIISNSNAEFVVHDLSCYEECFYKFKKIK